MGDLEGLPFGAYSAVSFCGRALDRTSLRYESFSENVRFNPLYAVIRCC